MPARCACGRFLGNVRVPVLTVPFGYGAGTPKGDCSRCGPDRESIEGLSWEEAFGDWDPDGEVAS